MKIILIFVLFLFISFLNSKVWRPGYNCKFGVHYRMVKYERGYYRRFHSCICPKSKKCKKIKKCKFGIPYQEYVGGCEQCMKCRKTACPILRVRKSCIRYASRMREGCERKYCIQRKCPPLDKCKTCKYGVKSHWNWKDGCRQCPICNKKHCEKLNCLNRRTSCKLGFEPTVKDERGCEIQCPTCKCPVNNWNLKCQYGEAYAKFNKDGCFVNKCRKTPCQVVEQPKKKCDHLWYDYKKGCKIPMCWENPCKKYQQCPKLNCTYGMFSPRDQKTGCTKCSYCEKDPTVKPKPKPIPEKIDLDIKEINKIEKVINWV